MASGVGLNIIASVSSLFHTCLLALTYQLKWHYKNMSRVVDTRTVVPTKSDSDVLLRLQSLNKK